MKIFHFFLPVTLFFATAALSNAETLVIMHTNDVHGCIEPERAKDNGGVLRRKVAIDSIRNAEKNAILVDAGDDVQGFMYFTLYGGKVEYSLMNALGYEIAIPGNHEFDNGLERLAENYDLLKAEKLCANYDFSSTPMQGKTKPYTIRSYDSKNIAFVGVGCQPKGMIADENVVGVVYSDAMAVADSIAGELKKEKKADYVVVLSHIGYPTSAPGLPSDTILAATSRHVDLVIGGHSHTLINPSDASCPNRFIKNKDGKTVLVAQTGKYGQYLGKITIDLDHLDRVPGYELLPIDSRYDNRLDTSLQEWLKPYREGVDALMSQKIGTSAEAMDNGDIGALTNWVADMAYDIGSRLSGKKVDFAIVNKGGVRRPMPEGNVSLGLIESMLPFNNSVLLLEIDGQSLLEAFDIMAQRGGDAISRHASAGMKNGKAVEVTIGGMPIDPSKTYIIATIDYLAQGGDNMEPLKNGTIIAHSKNLIKTDAVEYVKALEAQGKLITADKTARMYHAD